MNIDTIKAAFVVAMSIFAGGGQHLLQPST